MKLIFIKKNFSVHGGAENYMKTLIAHLRDKADIHVVAKKWIESPGITFHRIDSLSLGSFLSTIAFNAGTCRKIKTLRADCVISFERTTCQDIYRAGEGCHREWLRLREMSEPFWKKYTFMINPLHIALLRIEKQLFSDTKIIIANSNMVKSQIIRHYSIPEEKIQVIYNGVDLKRFSPLNINRHRTQAREELSINKDTGLVLFVGSGFERKGLNTLLRAISLMSGSNIKGNKNNPPSPPFSKGGMGGFEDLKLLVIGKGNIKKFQSIAKKYGINDRVLFLGPQKEIEKFYAAADIFALPTIYDPFSNATLEAMASGLPVITTKNNGVSEIIQDGEEGFAIENPLDYNMLSEKIKSALAEHESMGRKARLRAEKFPIEKAAEEFIKIIEGLFLTSSG
ncbi:MAG: glycosyltransferase family 4 protein [Thermodesulfovibrionales bacterium]|nr:glycosyltransferase family 4 protein [Thermodesulfovibrionales bacterium]